MTVAELMSALQGSMLDPTLAKTGITKIAAVGDTLRVELTTGEQYTLRVTSSRSAPLPGRCTTCNRLLNEKEKDSELKLCNRCEHEQGK